MPKRRRGGYVFVGWKGDHSPRHVHVFKNGKLARRIAVKIAAVKANNHKRAFDVTLRGSLLAFPYSKADPVPNPSDPVERVYVDDELGREAFTYVLKSGEEGSVHVDSVLEYNEDPKYMRDLLLYHLTIEARRCMASHRVSKNELLRRIKTSASQLSRLLDPTNKTKSLDKMVELLGALDCEVELMVRPTKRNEAGHASTPIAPLEAQQLPVDICW
jgi:DNA-binding Xre family transcriptional regulator